MKRSACLILAAALAALLIPFPKTDSRMFSVAMDLGHFPLFLLLTFVVLRLAPQVRLLPVFIGSLLIQLGLEELQELTGRSASVQDVVLGFSGTLAATAIDRAAHRRTLFVGLCLLPVCFWGLGNMLDERRSHHSIPVLSDFASPFASGRWEVNGMRARWTGYTWVLEKDDPHENYPGISWKNVPPDWSGYAGLDVHLVGEGAFGILRLDDREDPGFEERLHYRLDPGAFRLSADLSPQGMVEGHPVPTTLEEVSLVRATLFFPEMKLGDRIEIRRIVLMPR